MRIMQWKMASSTGPIYLTASEKGLRSLLWTAQDLPVLSSTDKKDPVWRIFNSAQTQLNEYFEGRRQTFDLELDLVGTDFQRQVWSELMRIPYGQTASYRDVARRIANEKATRAVGSANGRNPICILIPCHRVIAANGTLGGYSGGLDKKIQLLELERTLHKIKL